MKIYYSYYGIMYCQSLHTVVCNTLQEEQALNIAERAISEYRPPDAPDYNDATNRAIDEIQRDVSSSLYTVPCIYRLFNTSSEDLKLRLTNERI